MLILFRAEALATLAHRVRHLFIQPA